MSLLSEVFYTDYEEEGMIPVAVPAPAGPDVESADKTNSVATASRVRQQFPETWIWQSVATGYKAVVSSCAWFWCSTKLAKFANSCKSTVSTALPAVAVTIDLILLNVKLQFHTVGCGL